MRQRRSLGWVLMLSLFLALLPAAGASAAPMGAPHAQSGGPAFKLELPRIVVTVDKDGAPSIFGLNAANIAQMTGMALPTLPADLVQMMAQAGVQHVEVSLTGQGVYLFANGSPLPYLTWSQESLTNLVSALNAFQVPVGNVVGQFVPFLEYVSITVAVQFPLPDGATAVRLRDAKSLPLVDAAAAQGEVAEGPSAILYAVVDVDSDGVPAIMGVSTSQIQEQSGIDLSTAQVPTTLMAQMAAGGVQHIQATTKPDGLFLYMNGKPLPSLVWDQARLATLADLLPKLLASQPWTPLAGLAIPTLQAADVQLTVKFPLPSGAQEVAPVDLAAGN